jgi:aspartate/methionine/tyrosine aminotransferase
MSAEPSAAARAEKSVYLEWAKLCSGAKYNLAASGIAGYPLRELPVRIEELEINGPTVYGYEPLQERLARKSGTTPDCIVAANGTAMANHLAMAAVLSPGDDVLVEQPTYGPMFEVASYYRASIRRLPRRAENDFQVDPDEVKALAGTKTKLIVLANLHNPSGALLPEATLRAIGETAARVGARVLVDEVYLDMTYGEPQKSSFALGPQFIVTNSLTKAYGLSGLRCGWIVAEAKLAERMWRMDDLFAGSPVHVSELLSVKALDHLDAIDRRARGILAANRAAFDALWTSGAGAELDGFRSRWGTVVFPRLKKGNVDGFCEYLQKEYETSVVPGRFFDMPDHFRVGLGGDVGMTAEGLRRLGKAIERFR